MRKTITAIERQKRHPKRCSLFLDGKFACGLDEEIVLALNLKVGQEINDAEVNRVIFKEATRKAKDYALNLLTYRPRSCKEIRDRLKRKNYSEEVIEEVIGQLRRLRFLDDARFARSWTESRFLNKPLGRKLLERELRQKGIDNEIIQEVAGSAYEEQSEEKIALDLARKRLNRYGNKLDDPVIKRRLYGYLGRRGFSPDIIRQVLNRLEQEIHQ